ncbi:hypothetical protein B0H10DRAFT_2214116 [Mycena sp. CBHHK59/15]|nr:hypothetical protein B0H10DRAFT_2214116 [Mycena sp. CBHHK59/15]
MPVILTCSSSIAFATTPTTPSPRLLIRVWPHAPRLATRVLSRSIESAPYPIIHTSNREGVQQVHVRDEGLITTTLLLFLPGHGHHKTHPHRTPTSRSRSLPPRAGGCASAGGLAIVAIGCMDWVRAVAMELRGEHAHTGHIIQRMQFTFAVDPPTNSASSTT